MDLNKEFEFRTKYTNPPPSDCETYVPGTSLTVPDQVEPLEVVVKRCLRGEYVKIKEGYYENDGIEDEDAAFDTLDRTSSPGFDLADVSSLLSEASSEAIGGADAEPSTEGVAKGDGQTDTESKTKSEDSSTLE